MKIKTLSNITINRIAAGEVIERPASVIKELVENAIDAGSSKIDITLERAGKNLIIVSDDGLGLSAEDLEIAVERHTTSKLDEEDLLNINTFGFRGEALPSIGSVSKLQITSKARGAREAFKLHLIGGNDKQIIPTIHHEGTKVEVRDLFFATPARLKFLRTDKTEFAAILDIVKKIALAHPHISFSMSHEGKSIIKVRGQSVDLETALKQRIGDLINKDFIQNSSEVNLSHPDLSIMGYVGLPTFNRASSEDQFLFVNNRPVKDKILNIALRIAYQDYLARDRHPIAVLFLKIDPQLVDVNVHPAKSEVRFHDPNTVRGLMISAIKEALAINSHKASTHIAASALGFFNPKTAPSSPFTDRVTNYTTQSTLEGKISSSRQTQNLIPGDSSWHYSSEYKNNHISDINNNYKSQSLPQPQTLFIQTAPESKVEEDIITNDYKDFPLGAAKAQLHATYIIAQTDDSIIIVDQHAAHERIGYEKIKEIISKNNLIKQRLLIPEIVELPDNKRAEILYDKREHLSTFGLTLQKFGDKSIIVSEIPSLLGDVNVQQLIQDLADHLYSIGENIKLSELIEHITETYACHHSIRSGRKLTIMEMNELLRQMEQTPFSGQCNHGRPTYIELKIKDVEKLFGRR